jgi:TolB protein
MIARSASLVSVSVALALFAVPATAQQAAAVIAIPPLTTPDEKATGAGSPAAVAWQASQLIASDLRTTAELVPVGPDQKDYYSYPEVTAPTFSRWRAKGAKFVLTGFVRSRPDGRLTVGCYVYDTLKGTELGRTGFVVAPEDWRRAAHKCSGIAYTAATGAPGIFDSRIAYVAESGPPGARIKRIAIMDGDGNNQSFVTAGDTIVLTPRLSPKAENLAFVSYANGQANIRIVNLASSEQHALVAGSEGMSFAPRFAPDGRRIVFSMQAGVNTDIYVADSSGGPAQRLTAAPGIDTDPSFSPDGTRIAFESDRSGNQQIYTMAADGTGQRRISFGGGWYAAPVWSPDGEWIAFTRRIPGAGSRIGVMKPDGSGEKLLTEGALDEGPSWAASGHELIFQRAGPDGRPALYRVTLAGGDARKVVTPQDASDPDWSGVVD